MSHTVSAGGRSITVEKDLRIPMRDGVVLVGDAYGVGDEPKPALVALSPYGKELQALALTMPPQRRPSARRRPGGRRTGCGRRARVTRA